MFARNIPKLLLSLSCCQDLKLLWLQRLSFDSFSWSNYKSLKSIALDSLSCMLQSPDRMLSEVALASLSLWLYISLTRSGWTKFLKCLCSFGGNIATSGVWQAFVSTEIASDFRLAQLEVLIVCSRYLLTLRNKSTREQIYLTLLHSNSYGKLVSPSYKCSKPSSPAITRSESSGMTSELRG